MCIRDRSYDFTYTIDGNKLMIDYANKSVRYSEYEFTVDGNTLTLIGGEGTVGGTYAVSYTHLDVYKRQGHILVLDITNYNNFKSKFIVFILVYTAIIQ